MGIIAWLIPDVPEKVQLEIQKEILLASEAQLKRKEVKGEEEEEGLEEAGEGEKEGKSSLSMMGYILVLPKLLYVASGADDSHCMN